MAVREKEVKIIRPKKAGEQADIIRVGAYCRVSTDSEDQQNSFFAQVKYYNDYIRQNEKMRLVDIYADEGITGTEMRKREEFKRMLKDARSRKLDRILVKSVTRFARNALECIESVRELTSCGVSVFFENDNLDTKQMNSEMLLYIKSEFAQQESVSASRRMSTSIRMRMENGNYRIVSAPYGYKIEDGDLVVSRAEAENVKKIFELYLSGMGEIAIIKHMQTHDMNGGELNRKHVAYILKNERYIGDTLLQKKYTPAVLPLRKRINRGQVKYVKQAGERQFFQGKIFCKKCGWGYKKHIKGDSVYWKCGKKGMTMEECHAPNLSDKDMRAAFVRMFNTLKQNEKTVVNETILQLQALKAKVNGGNGEIGEIDAEMAALSKQNSSYSDLFLKGVIDDILYFEKTDRLKSRMSALRERRLKLVNEDEEEKCLERLRALKRVLDNHEFLVEMDESLFNEIVDRIYVEQDGALVFVLKCELKLRIERQGGNYGK